MSSSLAPPPHQRTATTPFPHPGAGRAGSTVLANGEPMIWLTGGALAVALAMILGLLALVLVRGLSTFWPQPLVQLTTVDGKPLLGEITQIETYRPSDQLLSNTFPVRLRGLLSNWSLGR